ncbi:periplasmic binding protein-like I [Sporodiniella umbellata]|nr:periplasmic binding protein-like I [Sporodiniella umbellata]
MDIVVTNELAISLAAESIEKLNILPDVQLNITRYNSSLRSDGATAWEAFKMSENNIKAVIGDVIMDLTQSSASVMSLWHVPQCSPSDDPISMAFPYLFRTTSTITSHGGSLAQWVYQMGWKRFSVMYTDTNLGGKIVSGVASQSKSLGLTIVKSLPILRPSEDAIAENLIDLKNSGSRVVVLIASRRFLLRTVISQARKLGLFSEGWVWLLADDSIFHTTPKIDINNPIYNGLMYMSNVWNLTGEPAYDSLQERWLQQPVPSNYSNPNDWNTLGLSHGAPQAYSCLELFAHGINKALDEYPGGRSAGLVALADHSFNTSNMLPSFYNFQYNGPAGIMNFTNAGDLVDGHFKVSYLLNGQSIPYATLNSTMFQHLSNDSIVYLGGTTTQPPDIASQTYLNPTIYNAAGIVIIVLCSVGILACILSGVLIMMYRHLKPIMISSPVFCYLQLLGLIMCYLSLLVKVGKPSPSICISRQFLLPMGFVFVIGSIIAKNFRVYKIYQNVYTVRTSRLRSAYLLRIVGIFQLFVIVPFVVWNVVYKIKVSSYQLSPSSFCYYCQYDYTLNGQDGRLNLAQLFVIIWIFVLIISAAFLAFKTRGVSSKWSETTQMAYVSYNLAVSAIVLIPSLMLSDGNYIITLCLNIAAILFGATFTLIVLFVPKLIFICRHIRDTSSRLSLFRMNSQSKMSLSPLGRPLDKMFEDIEDSTLKAHEGMLPVKKVAKLHFFSIWELKRILLVPLQKYFILSDNLGQNATFYNYEKCDIVPLGKKEHHIFRVFTEEGTCFLFQVYDVESLERWVGWFNTGPEPPEISLPEPSQAPGRMPKDNTITFGHTPTRYPQSSTHNSSRLTSQTSLYTNPLPSTESHNSFGVPHSAWSRYPK